jgi:putative ABC transport system substrate-binding protein
MMQIPEKDPETQARLGALTQGLQQLGWVVGSNLQLEYRGTADMSRVPAVAAELISLAPEVILAVPTRNVKELQKQTGTIPLVFVNVADPLTNGLVASLARPGGNTTGFLGTESSLAAKWLQLLKEMAPGIKQVFVLVNPDPANQGYLKVIEESAPVVGVRVASTIVQGAEDIHRTMNVIVREPGCGLIALPGGPVTVHRKAIFASAALHRLPAIYAFPYYAVEGGLMSYGTDVLDQWRRAASYVDRILRGEKAGDLPVQAPTKFQLVINRRTAKAIGLTVPSTLMVRADQVID